MEYKSFKLIKDCNILRVCFDYPPVNIQDDIMINELISLTNELDNDTSTTVVIFESNNENFFIAHTDIKMLRKLHTTPVKFDNIKISNLQLALQKINNLKQVTIAKIEGFARGGGHEFCLACDLRYALRDKAVFMQMEVGMGVLPCGGGSSRIARHIGLGSALEMVLSAKDYSADEAFELGLVNKVLDKEDLDFYVNKIANRISKFPLDAIAVCKKTIYNSLNISIDESLKYEEYELYQALSKTPAHNRFRYAYDTNFQDNLGNQINFETKLMDLQNIK